MTSMAGIRSLKERRVEEVGSDDDGLWWDQRKVEVGKMRSKQAAKWKSPGEEGGERGGEIQEDRGEWDNRMPWSKTTTGPVVVAPPSYYQQVRALNPGLRRALGT